MVENIKPPSLPDVTDILNCTNADTDWYMGMPTNTGPGTPNVETILQLYEGQDAILEPFSPMTNNQLEQWDG